MAEGQGKKNKEFLKKFVSKKVLREKLQEQRNAKIDARKEWAKKVTREEKKKKDRWKSSSTIPNVENHHNYQEKAYQNISGGNQTKAISSIVIPPPRVKSKKNKQSIVIPFRVKSKKNKRKKKTKKLPWWGAK